MSGVYLIKPLEKKRIVWHVEMFRENEDGSVSWFNIDETYRWGRGYIQADMDANLPYQGDRIAYCKADADWEFDDSISIDWEFSDDIPALEQQELKELYYEGGVAWLFDGEHTWQEEDTAVHIIAPYQVDLCDADGTVVEENVKLKSRPVPGTGWPFSPADSEQGGQ